MKQENFVIEVAEIDGKRKYVIRNMKGLILKFADSSEEVAQFFDEFKFAV